MKKLLFTLFTFLTITLANAQTNKLVYTSTSFSIYQNDLFVDEGTVNTVFIFTEDEIYYNLGGEEGYYLVQEVKEVTDGEYHFHITFLDGKWTEEVIIDTNNMEIIYKNSKKSAKIYFQNVELVD